MFTPDPIAVGIPTGGRPDPDRHQRVDHHQRHELPACATRAAASRMPGARRRRQPDRRPGRPVRRSARHDPADRRPRSRAQGLRPGADGRGPDHGPGRLRPRRAAEGWGASVFVQVLDPEAFAGGAAFRRQTGWIADACRASAPGPASSGCACPAKPPSPAAPRRWPTASSSIPASWTGCGARQLASAPRSDWPGPRTCARPRTLLQGANAES